MTRGKGSRGKWEVAEGGLTIGRRRRGGWTRGNASKML